MDNRRAAERDIEVVFVSFDHDQDMFNGYYEYMPWLAVPFTDEGLRTELATRYNVDGLPALVILDASGNVVHEDGRDKMCAYLGERSTKQGGCFNFIACSIL